MTLATKVYTSSSVAISSPAGHFAYTPTHGDSLFLAIASTGKPYNAHGEVSEFGSRNRAGGVSYTGIDSYKHFVLSDDGALYGTATGDRASKKAFAGYKDVVTMRAFSRDVCAIRSNNEVRCAGTKTGGTFDNPTLMGDVEAEDE